MLFCILRYSFFGQFDEKKSNPKTKNRKILKVTKTKKWFILFLSHILSILKWNHMTACLGVVTMEATDI